VIEIADVFRRFADDYPSSGRATKSSISANRGTKHREQHWYSAPLFIIATNLDKCISNNDGNLTLDSRAVEINDASPS
jgi:hypothetical protein